MGAKPSEEEIRTTLEETHELRSVRILVTGENPAELLKDLEHDLEEWLPECLGHYKEMVDLKLSETQIDALTVLWAPKDWDETPYQMVHNIILEFIRENPGKIRDCEINGKSCGTDHIIRSEVEQLSF